MKIGIKTVRISCVTGLLALAVVGCGECTGEREGTETSPREVDVVDLDTALKPDGTDGPDMDVDGSDSEASPQDVPPDLAGECVPSELSPEGDRDRDGAANGEDNCPCVPNADQADEDRDGYGDDCDNCPEVANHEQADHDSDGTGDWCAGNDEPDRDGDGVADPVDNCPDTKDTDQRDGDRDGVGDACDNCHVSVPNPCQNNSDGDKHGNACEDVDGDGVENAWHIPLDAPLTPTRGADNCPLTPNPGQANTDSDPYGDACDNCPDVSNRDQGQTDPDLDVIGDECDNCPQVANRDQDPSVCREDPCRNQTDAGCPHCSGESCDGKDNDCDGRTDERCPDNYARQICRHQTFFPEQCTSLTDEDCDGSTDEVCPEGCKKGAYAGEVCNGIDDDCDCEVDEGCP